MAPWHRMSAFERWQKANHQRTEELRLESEKRAKWQMQLDARQRSIPMRGRSHMRPTIAGIPVVEDPFVPQGYVYLIDTQYMSSPPDFAPADGTFGGAGASADWLLPGDVPSDTSSSISDSGSPDSGSGGGSSDG